MKQLAFDFTDNRIIANFYFSNGKKKENVELEKAAIALYSDDPLLEIKFSNYELFVFLEANACDTSPNRVSFEKIDIRYCGRVLSLLFFPNERMRLNHEHDGKKWVYKGTITCKKVEKG